jgi:putative transposase
MKLIDKQYMKTPFYGVMRMTTYLRNMGYRVNAKRVRRLYRLMDLQAMGPRPKTSKPHKGKGHTVFPYFLRNLKITHSYQVWALDITYVPVSNGYMYLFAIIDLYSRYIVGRSLSNTMTTQWYRYTLGQAIKDHGKPEIINTNQRSQFAAIEFTEFVTGQGITISMEKGRAIDNIFIERFWRNIK